jgi:hypothetical protein
MLQLTALIRVASSTRWLRRQLTDPFVRRAHEEEMVSRAAFKLQQMQEKYHFLEAGQTVIDLGRCGVLCNRYLAYWPAAAPQEAGQSSATRSCIPSPRIDRSKSYLWDASSPWT